MIDSGCFCDNLHGRADVFELQVQVCLSWTASAAHCSPLSQTLPPHQ